MADDDNRKAAPDGPAPQRNGLAAGGETVVRFFKYAVLLGIVAVTLQVTFDCYSYYIARRSIDAELQAKNVSSLESLMTARQRNRDDVVALFETRCVERDIIALYRVMDGRRAALNDASRAMFRARTAATDNLRKHGQVLLAAAILDRLTGVDFDISSVDLELVKEASLVDGVKPDDPRLRALREQWEEDRDSYQKRAAEHRVLLSELAQLKDLQLSVASVRILEDRFSRLKKLTEAERQREEAMAEVLARYDMWTQALAPKGTIEQLVDVALDASQIAQAGQQQALRCDAVGAYRQAMQRLNDDEEKWEGKTLLAHAQEPAAVYRRLLFRYFQQAPAAQTLFVTLLIGALGALTLNILRLSKVGWWANHNDPDWGEIFIGPFLGALAAFGIYLVGSAGLLLTSDLRSGPSSLSAVFIGLLGFVSGLLYDEAFGRVRRVGSQIFSGDKADEASRDRPEDLALARVLQAAGATLVASLVTQRKLGLRLLAGDEFTLVVPSDLALAGVTLQWWTDMNDLRKPAFEDWFRHHRSAKKLMVRDVAAGQKTDLVMDDGRSIAVTASGSSLRFDGVDAVKVDLAWEKGVIHVLGGELPG